MDFRRLLPEIRWQSCLFPDPGTQSLGLLYLDLDDVGRKFALGYVVDDDP